MTTKNNQLVRNMKKTILLAALALGPSAAQAIGLGRAKPVQIGVGLNVGTNGVGLDASLGLTRFVQVRGGYTFVPKCEFEYEADVYNDARTVINAWNAAMPDLAVPVLSDDTPVIIQPNASTAHLLLDVYPGRAFHLTVGAYFGQEDVLHVWNTEKSLTQGMYVANECIDLINGMYPDMRPINRVGVQMGNYLFTPDAEGNIMAEARVKKVRPYAGVGFGRAVPRKRRMGCSLDLGVQYWGRPTYYCNGIEVAPADLKTKSYIRAATRLPVYPVLTFRLCGRIF